MSSDHSNNPRDPHVSMDVTVGTPQTDLTARERWSFGETFINDITAAGHYREYLVTIGQNSDGLTSEVNWRLFRVPVSQDILMGQAMDSSVGVQTWGGFYWVAPTYTCASGVGPCWEDVPTFATCCSLDSDNDLSSCVQGSGGGGFTDSSGDRPHHPSLSTLFTLCFVRINSSRLISCTTRITRITRITSGLGALVCSQEDSSVDSLVLYVRYAVAECISTSVANSDRDSSNPLTGTNTIQVTCDEGYEGSTST